MRYLIPEDIRKKIIRYNKQLTKAHELVSCIVKWYDKELDKYKDIIDEFTDEDFNDIYGCDNYISVGAINENLQLLEEGLAEKEHD